MQQEIVFVVARDLNGGIGKDNALPWKLSSDLQHFKALTLGHTVVMGRNTADGLHKALVNRTNVVLTRKGYDRDGFESYSSVNAILDAYPDQKLFVIGGAQTFEAFERNATEIVLTEVQTTVDVDTWYKWQPEENWELVSESPIIQKERDQFPYVIKTFRRRVAPATRHL